MDFIGFPKIPRLSRRIVVSEKIDGTNAQINIRPAVDSVTGEESVFERGVDIQISDAGVPTLYMRAGSRSRWISVTDDNHGFARWVYNNALELAALGVGAHFGEWWGSGINRGYGLVNGEKRFSLFNTGRWVEASLIANAPPCFSLRTDMQVAPACCHVVPVLYDGQFSQEEIEATVLGLEFEGSRAAKGFMNPEGVVVWHDAARSYFKKTIRSDEEWKGKAAA